MNYGHNISKYFNWYDDNPNQGREANFAGLILVEDQPGYLDATTNRRMCVMCQIKKALTFTLWGACKDSFFGELIHNDCD